MMTVKAEPRHGRDHISHNFWSHKTFNISYFYNELGNICHLNYFCRENVNKHKRKVGKKTQFGDTHSI